MAQSIPSTERKMVDDAYRRQRQQGAGWHQPEANVWEDEGSWRNENRSVAGGPARSLDRAFSSSNRFGGRGGGVSAMAGGQRRPISAMYNTPSQGGMRGGPPQSYRMQKQRSNWPAPSDEFGGGASSSSMVPPPGDGTWANRDGRHYYPERESEVFKSTRDKTTGINFDSYDSIEVEVSGPNTREIAPMSSFRNTAEMPPELAANIIRVRYDKPTPVQKYAIPFLIAGRDLMACAQTGSGKTAAFLFPIIIKMLRQGPPTTKPTAGNRSPVPKPVALVLSPTRELTVQIYEESRKFAFHTGIRTVVVYGGANIGDQFRDLNKGCDICVATPGRLNDILERSKISLSQVTYLVLDEADRMLDMGFSPQIHQIVSSRDMPTSHQGRQTAMFSATFPREIQQLARDFLLDYVYLTVGRVGSTNEFITQKLVYADENEKPKRLLQLLREARGRVLVFVETKKKADVIEDYLLNQGLQATSIHGDRTQMERSRALELFKSGECPILVATDVAARGLDIHSITWVINLDLPHNIEDYVHRIGRTGRAGNAGMATSFVNESNRHIIRELLRLLEEANQEIPKWLVDLAINCSSASKGFGASRYGGGNRRGGMGMSRSGGDFGGQDMRSFDDHERQTYNASGLGGMGSPRGGSSSAGRNGGRGGGMHRGGPRGGAPAPPPPPSQHIDCW